ncbi:MAG TPA: multidrug resistance protein [Actinomycetota bacterium]|nr:multidrug resistance protein [Actinomycetota bacterium]
MTLGSPGRTAGAPVVVGDEAEGNGRRKLLVIAFILLSVALAAAAQLTLKFGVDRVTEHGRSGIILGQPVASALRVAREPFVWAGLVLFGMSAAVWIVVLSRTRLSFAYPFAALTYVIILLADRFLLKAQVPPLRWAGVALICTGIFLISRTGSAT